MFLKRNILIFAKLLFLLLLLLFSTGPTRILQHIKRCFRFLRDQASDEYSQHKFFCEEIRKYQHFCLKKNDISTVMAKSVYSRYTVGVLNISFLRDVVESLGVLIVTLDLYRNICGRILFIFYVVIQ